MSRVLGMIRNVQNFPAYLLHKWGIKKQNPFILQAREGISVEVPDRMMHTAKELFFTDDYRLDRIKADVLRLTDRPVVVDVGANVGYFAAFCFTRFPKATVISVEPIPKNLSLLETNRSMNSDKDWKVFEGAVSNSDGEITIKFDDSDSFTTAASAYEMNAGSDEITVHSIRLEKLMEENQLERIHILKLDCEGSEYDILYSLGPDTLKRIAFVSMETHEVDSDRKNNRALTGWFQKIGWKTDVTRSLILATNPMFQKD